MIPLFTTLQVKEADKYASEKLNIPGIVLMENASKSIFEIILDTFEDLQPFSPIGIVCGKGNNGGDGFALARHFINEGFTVKIVLIGDEKDIKGDALINLKIYKNLINIYTDSELIYYEKIRDLNKLAECELIIDAMIGTGSKGSLKDPFPSIISKLNDFNSYKVAIDIPTGLDADTGHGDAVFNADLTVSLAELKRGLFVGKGYVNSGKVEKGYIGIGEEYFSFQEQDNFLIEPEDAVEGLPDKKLDAYKYSSGKVLVIAGSGLMPGASTFTTNSCMKVGAGAVYLAFPRSIKEVVQSKLDSALVFAYDDDGTELLTFENVAEFADKIKWSDVVALGPGLGRDIETSEAVYEIMLQTGSKKAVIDADAIWALKGDNYKNINLNNKVFTPHYKEFAELIGVDLLEIKNDPLKHGRQFATENGVHLVLKGAPTIIFTPDGDALINSAGNPGMAKFGTGDVLTGVIAGFMAQTNDIEQALISAVYIHSLAADLLVKDKTLYGITSTDIMENLPATLKFLRDSFE